ncbi:MAG: hypothetical protein ACP5LE_08025 [Thermoplasmata archaeon]
MRETLPYRFHQNLFGDINNALHGGMLFVFVISILSLIGNFIILGWEGNGNFSIKEYFYLLFLISFAYMTVEYYIIIKIIEVFIRKLSAERKDIDDVTKQINNMLKILLGGGTAIFYAILLGCILVAPSILLGGLLLLSLIIFSLFFYKKERIQGGMKDAW